MRCGVDGNVSWAHIMTDIFSTREITIGIWIIIGLGLSSYFPKVRKSLFQLIKAATSRHMVILYLAIFMYCSMIVYTLYRANFWQWSFLKDTVMWSVLSGVGSSYDTSKKMDSKTK